MKYKLHFQNWPYSLLEALSPRTECGPTGRRRGRGDAPEAGLLKHFSEDATPTEIVAAFKQAEQRELAAIKELRYFVNEYNFSIYVCI